MSEAIMTEDRLRQIVTQAVAQAVAEVVTEAVSEAVAEAVSEALDQVAPDCACDIGPEAAGELGHFMGMVRDLGGGDTAQGVEAMRESLRFVPRLMRLRDRIGTWVLSILVAAATGGALTLLWEGLRLRIGGSK